LQESKIQKHKEEQLKIVRETNPMWNDTSVGIRKIEDIKTFEECVRNAEEDSVFVWGDYSKEDAERDLKRGKVTIYSSYPIKNGVFVSTSYQQAYEYAGHDASQVHQRTVNLDSVAWINGDEGQYAKVKPKVDANKAEAKLIDNLTNNIVVQNENISDNEIYSEARKQASREYKNVETDEDYDNYNNRISEIENKITDKLLEQGYEKKENKFIKNEKEVRYSLPVNQNKVQKDNKGRALSKEQVERFKNSVVRDNNGNLKTVYHGTDADFTVFNYDYLGKNGTANGKGFYLADDKNVAKSYSNGKNIIEAYVNIEKPLKIGETSITRDEYIKFVEAINNKTNGRLFADYGDGEPIVKNSKEYNEILNDFKEEYVYGGDDVDLVLSVLNSANISLEEGYRTLRNTLGYDGIIVDTDYKGENGETIPYTQYIPLTPEQIKDVNNQKPTDNPDIRYSRTTEQQNKWEKFLNYVDERTGKKERTYYKQLAPETASINDNNTKLPVAKKKLPVLDKETKEQYTKLKKERADLSNELSSTKKEINNRKSEMKKMIKEIFNHTNEAEINSIVDKVLDNKVRKESLISELDNYSAYVEADKNIVKDINDIKKYLKETKIDTTSVRADISNYNDFRKKNIGILNLGSSGVQIDSLYQELLSNFPGYFDETISNPADQIKHISDFLTNDAKTMTEAQEYQYSEEELSDIADMLLENRKPLNNLDNYVKDLNKMIEKNSKKITEIEDISLRNQRDNESLDALVDEIEKKERKLPEAAQKKIDSIGEKSSFESLTNTRIADKRKQKKSFKSFKENVKTSANSLYQKFVNHNHYIDKLAKKSGNKNLMWQADKTLGASGIGQYNIGKAQTDINGKQIGKSLSSIFTEIENNNLSKEFSEYMYLKHNSDREAVHKPIFGSDISTELSNKMSQEYEKNHPEFKQYAKDVYQYIQNENQLIKDAGMVSNEQMDYLTELYPNYVPVERIMEKESRLPTDNTLSSGNGIKKATGGNSDIMPLQEALAMRTMRLRRAVEYNNLMKETFKTLKNAEVTQEDFVLDGDFDINTLFSSENAPVQIVDGKYQGLYFEDGLSHKFEITKDLYDSLKSATKWDIEDSLPLKALQKASNMHRDFLTKYSATFPVKNAIKDIQDVAINSKNLKEFVKAYPKAIKEMKNDGAIWNQYLANGGGNNSYFDYETGILPTNSKNPIKKIGDKISGANEFIEQLPRFTEFMATLNRGGSINEAMYNAAEITTNFKRGGDITKAINRNGATFLNASVQGFDKFFRNFSEQKTAKQWVAFGIKVAVFGIAPAIANHLIYDDDDDYQDLRDSDKDLYYLFKYDDGKFIRIPKGRMLSVFGTAASRTLRASQGDNDAFDGMLETMSNQVAPNNPVTDNVIAPVTQAVSNKSWFGSEIVGSRLQKELPKNQYDENTDAFSIWLGQKLNISPKKINYVMDQYSGGVGDILLPKMSKAASKNVFEDQFTTDSVLKNKNVGKFYETIEKQTQLSNDPNSTDEDKLALNYLNSANSEISELYKQKRDIQNSNLKNKEKAEKVREIQAQINEKMKSALKEYKNVEKIDDDIAKIQDETYIKINNKWKTISDDDQEKIDKLEENNVSSETYLRYKIDNTYIDENGMQKQKKNAEKMKYLLENEELTDKEKSSMYEATLGENDKTYDKFEGDIDTYLQFKVDTDKEKGDKTSVTQSQKIDVLLNGNYDKTQMKQIYNVIGEDDTAYQKYKGNVKTYLQYKSDVNKIKGSKDSATQKQKFKVLTSGNYSNKEIQNIYDTIVDDEDYIYKALKSSNINMKEYLNYKMQDLSADRTDDGTLNGKSISGSAKAKKVQYINSMNITYEQKLILMGSQYKLSTNEREKVARYINSLKITAKDKQQVYTKMKGFTVYKNGRVTW